MRLKHINQVVLVQIIRRLLHCSGYQLLFFKVIAIIIIWVVALIPTWLFIFVWWLASPVGFWQVTVIVALGLFLGGGLQIAAGILAGSITVQVLTDDS